MGEDAALDLLGDLIEEMHSDARVRRALSPGGIDVLDAARHDWHRDVTDSRPHTFRSPPVRVEIAGVVGELRRPVVRVSRGTVLVVEPYAHIATTSRRVQGALRARGIPALHVAAAPRTAPPALEDLASRRARLRAFLWRHRAWRATRELHCRRPPDRSLLVAAERWWGRGAASASIAVDVVARVRPAAVVSTTESRTAVRALLLAATTRGVPRVVVQHGLQAPRAGLLRPIADRYLVWGPRDMRALVAAGVPADRIVITGWPGYDELPTRTRRAEAPEILYLAALPGAGVPIPVAQTILDSTADAVTAIGGRLVVKVHPRDRSGMADRLRGRDGVEVLPSSSPLPDALASADVAVVTTSTAGFEAIAAGCAIVVAAFPGVDVPRDYGALGPHQLPGDPAALQDALRRAAGEGFDPTSQLAVARDVLGDHGVGAGARIAEQIMQLISGRAAE